jgi:polygalacturonase
MDDGCRIGFVALACAALVACGSSKEGTPISAGMADAAAKRTSDAGKTGGGEAGETHDATAVRDAKSIDGSASTSDATGDVSAVSDAEAGSSVEATSDAEAESSADAARPLDAATDARAKDAAGAADARGDGSTGSPPPPDGGPSSLATGDTRTVTQPTYPPVCATLSAQFSATQRSSPPTSDDTGRIQAALDTCKATGQSVVLAVSGALDAFYAGTLTVDGETLVVDSGVTLFGNGNYTGELLAISGADAALMGPGTIDGRGDLISGTPRLIQANKITNFIVYNLTIEHPGKEHLYVEGGNGFTAWNLTIATPANTKNTDGIDIDSMTNVTVHGSSIEDGDDGVAIKTNSAGASNITIENNTFHGTHGMSIGSQTFDGVVNVLWKGNTVYGSDQWGNESTNNNGINIKTDVECGGTVRQVTYVDTCMTGVKHLLVFNTSYGSCTGTAGTPYFTDIVIDGVYSTSSALSAYSEFEGYSAAFPLGLTLENVDLDVTTQQGSQYAAVGLYNSNVTPAGNGVTTRSILGGGSVPTCSF